MKKEIDVSVVIVSFNTKELTLACLASLRKTQWEGVSHETIVVDNASNDGTVEEIKKQYPNVSVIQNKENLGFAKANNIGIRKSKGTYILLLNSDTEVEPETIPVMLQFLKQHQKAGAATCKLILSDGSMDPACHRGFPTPWASLTYMTGLEKLFPKSHVFGRYHEGYNDLTVPHEVDAISGAFFLVRRETVDRVGLLDEDFFMYGEDLDWAYRMKKNGWEIWFHPAVSVMHYKKQSGRGHGDLVRRKEATKYFYQTMKLFYRKHYEKAYPRVVTIIINVLLDIRMSLI